MPNEFVYEWGSGTTWCKSGNNGTAVDSGIIASSGDLALGTGIGDNYEISELSGGGSTGGGSYSDFSAYDTLAVSFGNNSGAGVWITLFMHVSWAAYAESGWTYFDVQEEKTISWDMSGISGLSQIGNIGFQVADFSAAPMNCASITVSAVPFPGALWLLGSVLFGLAAVKRKKTSRPATLLFDLVEKSRG